MSKRNKYLVFITEKKEWKYLRFLFLYIKSNRKEYNLIGLESIGLSSEKHMRALDTCRISLLSKKNK